MVVAVVVEIVEEVVVVVEVEGVAVSVGGLAVIPGVKIQVQAAFSWAREVGYATT